MTLILPKLISCDESGFSGNDMLGSGQPFFSYASHDLSLSEAGALLSDARSKFRVQMPELKASKLLKTRLGRALLIHVLTEIDGRYIATLYEKRLALACKWFEYIYEPVLQRNNILFYENNLHRFVAMFLYMQMKVTGADISHLAAEFEAFMRTLDPAKAPSLFGTVEGVTQHPLMDQIVRFARGYNVTIANEARILERTGSGKWVLDLSISAVFSHLRAWGERHPLIEVVCDDSKPLRALANVTNSMINRPEETYITIRGKKQRLTWNMTGPVAFASSATHPGVEVADLVAGVASALPFVADKPELAPLAELTGPHLHQDCIMPDFGVLDLEHDSAWINWMILESLASRADAGVDPIDGMEMLYAIARNSVSEIRHRFKLEEKSCSDDC